MRKAESMQEIHLIGKKFYVHNSIQWTSGILIIILDRGRII